MTNTSEVIELEAVTKKPKTFDITVAEIESALKEWEAFEIVDTATYKDVRVEKTRVVGIRNGIDTRRKDLNRKYTTTINGQAEAITAALAPLEEMLKAKLKVVDDEKAKVAEIKAKKKAADQLRIDYVLSTISNHAEEWASLISSSETAADLEEKTVTIETFKPELLVFEEFTADILAAKDKAIDAANLRWEELTAKEAEAKEQARIAEENRAKAEALAKLEAEMNAKIEAAAADEKRRNDIQATLSGWIDTHLSIMVNGTLGDIKEYCKKLIETVPTADEFGDRVDEAQTKLNSMAADAVLKRNTLEAESEIAEKARIQTEEFAAREKAIADAEAKVKADAEAKEAADRKAEADRIEQEWITTACEEAEEKARLRYAEDWIEAHAHNTEFEVAVAMAANMVAGAEEKERARIESLRPDKERILVFLRDVYGGIEFPVVSNPEADAILDKFSGDITALIHGAREKANAL